MENGIYPDMTDEEYFSIQAVSASFLKAMQISPENAWRKFMFTQESDALKFGSQMHDMCLYGPEVFLKKYPVKTSDINFRKKEGQKWRDNNPNYISEDQLDKLLLMQSHLPDFSASQKEVAIFWTDEATGLQCKAKIDLVNEGENGSILFDLKTFANSSSKTLDKFLVGEIYNKNYHLQAAHYANGWEALTGEKIEYFGFLFIEKDDHLPAFRVLNLPMWRNGNMSGTFEHANDVIKSLKDEYAQYFKQYGLSEDCPWKKISFVMEVNEDNTPIYLLPKGYRND